MAVKIIDEALNDEYVQEIIDYVKTIFPRNNYGISTKSYEICIYITDTNVWGQIQLFIHPRTYKCRLEPVDDYYIHRLSFDAIYDRFGDRIDGEELSEFLVITIEKMFDTVADLSAFPEMS